ncbi:hypothetical protein KBX53_18515 [Micromonospora sp. M51]|uniref:hypothetical protein n=1 Tax=Micromonospora sp. M51 TaxID=2824889 RepID=UPI001B36B861|nr:hypothetical protein [Micromonospora sp. M51]MBQ1012912.1 hypothetical protein [Micromonospora sp. M51]
MVYLLLQKLSLVEWVQVVSAVGAVAAAVAGFAAAWAGTRAARAANDSAKIAAQQLPEMQRQVEVGIAQAKAAERQVDLAQEAAKGAGAAVREASRARADERAPRVVALMEAPQWPPRVDSARTGMPYANELRLLDHRSIGQSSVASSSRPYVFHGQRNWFMWFRTRGVLINEGSATARVRLDGEAEFIEGTTPLAGEATISRPPQVGTPDRQEYLLRPGESALFEWASGHTLGEWAEAYENPNPPNPHGACFFTITVFDSFEHGVIDHIHAVMAGRPLVPVDGALGQWRITPDLEEAALGITVYPIRRMYQSEGWVDRPLPWEETYGEWRSQHEG